MVLNGLTKYRDFGLLFLRLGLGASMVAHGWGKLTGGPEMWEKVGGAMGSLGINFAPHFWGFMGSFAEVGGGVLLAAGLLFRPTLILLLVPTMFVAMMMHIGKGDAFSGYSHALELLIVFTALVFIGPGRFSVDEALSGKSGGQGGTRNAERAREADDRSRAKAVLAGSE